MRSVALNKKSVGQGSTKVGGKRVGKWLLREAAAGKRQDNTSTRSKIGGVRDPNWARWRWDGTVVSSVYRPAHSRVREMKPTKQQQAERASNRRQFASGGLCSVLASRAGTMRAY